MNQNLSRLAAAALLAVASVSAQAAYIGNSHIAAYGPGSHLPGDELILENDTAWETPSTRAEIPADAASRYGLQAQVASEAAEQDSGGRLSSDSSASWSGLSGRPDPVDSFSALSYIEHSDDGKHATAGRIRLVVDYELYAADPSASVSLSVGLSTFVDGMPHAYDSFYRRLTGSAEPALSKGSWTGKWMDFGASDAQDWWPSYEVTAQAATGVFADAPADSGSASSYGRLSYRYEIAPVPEPESYALLGLGLLGVAIARRRRNAR